MALYAPAALRRYRDIESLLRGDGAVCSSEFGSGTFSRSELFRPHLFLRSELFRPHLFLRSELFRPEPFYFELFRLELFAPSCLSACFPPVVYPTVDLGSIPFE
ncbi:MAG: hypothetical protein KIC38_08485 [Actinomycetaceae bacterium]|nr:hypothetical protein [Actinomycetaceae bacterium]